MSKGALQAALWKGPVPPPSVLEQYDRIVPKAGDRILTMAEEEARIRRDQLQKDHDSANRVKENDVNKYHANVKRGQYLAAAVMVGIISAIIVCAVKGRGGAAAAVAGMGAVGIVSSFVGRGKQ